MVIDFEAWFNIPEYYKKSAEILVFVSRRLGDYLSSTNKSGDFTRSQNYKLLFTDCPIVLTKLSFQFQELR